MFKLIIAGSRNFSDYLLLEKEVNSLIDEIKIKFNTNEIQIISGTARGADKLGELYAIRKGLPLVKFPAEWEKYGKSAGYIRNNQMAEFADGTIVFWDNKSKGSKHMIDISINKKLLTKIINY